MGNLKNNFHRLSQRAASHLMRRLGRYKFNRDDFVVVHQRIKIPHLPQPFSGYKILQISDLHIGHWLTSERLHGLVDMINSLEPDLVAITGDFISYELQSLRADLTNALTNITSSDGVVAVLGNHDHWFDPEGVRQVLEESGVIELPNDVIALNKGNSSIYIAGVDDVIVGNDDIAAVLQKLPQYGPAILLAHEPDFADTAAQTARFALQLSGHSHGSQIVLPGMQPLVRNPYSHKYPKGRYRVGAMDLYTNSGVGTHLIRLRVNCPPEITVFSLI